MSERKPRSGRMVGMAENVAAAVRRRQRERDPRVVLFDASGSPRVVAPSAAGYDALLEIAEDMLALLDGRSLEGISGGGSAEEATTSNAEAAPRADEPAA